MWLSWVDGILYRTANPQWEEYMAAYVNMVVQIIEPYLARNGGPVILAQVCVTWHGASRATSCADWQIENEYHGSSEEYVAWCGELTTQLNLDIPWLMCNGVDV